MPIITVSRGSLSGGALLAKKLGERLGLAVISREVIIEAAEKYGVSEADLIKGLESPPGLWERLTHKRERYTLAIQATLAEMVQAGDAVYHGLAGHFLLRELPCVIKVRLIAPLEYRARAAMETHHLSHEEAVKHITRADTLREQWVRHIYGVEWADPSLYDVIINLAHMNIDTATETVATLAGSKEFQSTDETRQTIADFALSTRVRAALKLKSDFPDEAIDVAAHRGVVHLSGGPSFEAKRQAIVRFVKEIAGVTTVMPDDDEGLASRAEATRVGRTAGDLMVPIERYPHIRQSATIREAMTALGVSSVVLHDGHLVTPRYVLVFDDDDQLVGVIGRRDLLRGLAPHLGAVERVRQSIGSVAPMTDLSMPVTLRWDALFSRTALSASWQPVATVMAPIRGTVRRDETLSAVVTTMIHHAIDLLPVTDGARVVGVVLTTDVFDTVAQFIAEQGATRPGT